MIKLKQLISEAMSRGGTVNDSFYNIANRADEIDGENIGIDTYPIQVKRLGPSEDGKLNEEIVVRYGNQHYEYFSIYDYKFGEDPTNEENYQKEYPFSLGIPTGNKDGKQWATKLGFNVEREESINEKNMKEQDINDPTYIPPGIGKQAITLDDAQHDQLMNKGSVLIKVDGKTYPLVWTGFDKTDESGDYDTMEEETLDESVDSIIVPRFDGGVEFFKRIAFKK